MKRLLVVLILLLLLFGVPYGLAKMGVIPVAKLTAKNPALAQVARTLGLTPQKRTVQAASREGNDSRPAPESSPAPTQPAYIARPSPPSLPSPTASSSSPNTTHRQIGWVAKVYEEMEPEEAVRIMEKMDDREVVPLLQRMKQRQVAQILALMPPDRAARLSRTLMIQR